VRLGVNLPGPFWISSRIKGCGCLTLMLLPIELSLCLLAAMVVAYIALAKYLWPRGWIGKAITIAIPIAVIIIGSVSGAASGTQPAATTSRPPAQTQAVVPAVQQSSSPAGELHHKHHRVTWAAFVSRYPRDAYSFHMRDARVYCSHSASGCSQQLRRHARQLGVLPVHPMPVASTSSSGGSGGGGCHPTTSSGNCYQPGEFCSAAEHGETGVAGDGETIKCEDNNGWRWEPA